MFAQHGEGGNGMDTADNVWRSPKKRKRVRQIGHSPLKHILRQYEGYFMSSRGKSNTFAGNTEEDKRIQLLN